MKRKIYLFGGVDTMAGHVSPLDHRWMADAEGGYICILDLTSRDLPAPSMYRDQMVRHFGVLAQRELVFVSRIRNPEARQNAVCGAGAVYIPGGDTEALLNNIGMLGLKEALCTSTCSIAGNSAGAIALCREAVLTSDSKVSSPKVMPGLGLVNFSIDPHYDSSHDAELIGFSAGRLIYGVPEESVVIREMESTRFFGPVWQFENGDKRKVN